MTRPAFIVNNRNKGPHVWKAVRGALAQTVPCEILICDFQSTDNSVAQIEIALANCPRGADHDVRFVKRAMAKPRSDLRACNEGILWMVEQTKGDWIFQGSSDDYSLPDRVKVCMDAVQKNPCSVVATTMFFEPPEGGQRAVSGFPTESGYLDAGEGLMRLAYGSCIAGYSREFLKKVGDPGANTIDVLWGYLGALDKGYYVVKDEQHVHVQHASLDNAGFQGKMLAAEGDEALRVAELNHFQLLRLYTSCMDKAQELHPDDEGVPQQAWAAAVTMAMGQAYGWRNAREALHEKGITPGVI